METSPPIRVFTRLPVNPRGFLCGATVVLLLFALGCQRTPNGGKDRPAPEAGRRGDAAVLARDLLDPDYPLPPGLITAWGDAGGECGWIDVEGLDAEFRPRIERKKAQTLAPIFPEWEVPGFRFQSWADGTVGKLRQPEAPFGLSLMGASIGDTGMKDLANLDRLQALSLFRTKITDAGLKELAGLKDLRLLDLGFTKTTDAGLGELAGLKELRALNLVDTGVADPGLKELAGLTQLQALCLDHTHVTDAGLKELIGLKHLQWLSLELVQNGAPHLRSRRAMRWIIAILTNASLLSVVRS